MREMLSYLDSKDHILVFNDGSSGVLNEKVSGAAIVLPE